MEIDDEEYYKLVDAARSLTQIEGFTLRQIIDWAYARFGEAEFDKAMLDQMTDQTVLEFVRNEFGYIHPDEVDVGDYRY